MKPTQISSKRIWYLIYGMILGVSVITSTVEAGVAATPPTPGSPTPRVTPPVTFFDLEITLWDLPRLQQRTILKRNPKSVTTPLLEGKAFILHAKRTQAIATKPNDEFSEDFLLPDMTLDFPAPLSSPKAMERYLDCEAKATTAMTDPKQLFRLRILSMREAHIFIPSQQLVKSHLQSIFTKRNSARIFNVMKAWQAGEIPEFPSRATNNPVDWEKRFIQLDEIANKRVIRQSFSINLNAENIACDLIPAP